MQFKYVFFDLDGTVTDPFEGIASSVSYALQKMGVDEKDIHNLERFIGPPLINSFKQFYGMTDEQADKAVCFYRETYGVKGIYQNKLYPGIVELLDKLKAGGQAVFMATSKPFIYAKMVTDYFNITHYFEHIEGAPMSHADVEKEFLIKNILDKFNISNLNQCVMIGDRIFDIKGAKGSGISSIGCVYGYGSREELMDAGADYLVDSVYDIIKIMDNV